MLLSGLFFEIKVFEGPNKSNSTQNVFEDNRNRKKVQQKCLTLDK